MDKQSTKFIDLFTILPKNYLPGWQGFHFSGKFKQAMICRLGRGCISAHFRYNQLMFFPQATSLSVIPPAEICDEIDSLRRRYGRLAAYVPPHITLVYPPFLSPEQWPVFCLEMAEFFAQTPPFEVTLRRIERFKGFPMALWFIPEDPAPLINLRNGIRQHFSGKIEPLPPDFTPHLSVGAFDDLPSLEATHSAVEAAWKPQTFVVDRLFFLVQQPEDGRWAVRDYLRLGQTP